jgi:kynurenine formamidase
MCEHYAPIKHAWKGWLPLPAASTESGSGPWTDLTHVLSEDMSRSPALPKPVFTKIVTMPEGNANVTMITMAVHHGTHVDAPRHFMIDGPTFDQIPLERLYGPAVIWRIEKPPLGVITADDLKAARPKLQRGDMVLLDTGWARHINTDLYEEHPYLSMDAAEWLVDQQVKLLGVDFSTLDLASHKRPAGFTWPVHQILLSHGVLVAEHIANLDRLANQRVEAMFLAVPLAGSDGAPARVIARPLDAPAMA